MIEASPPITLFPLVDEPRARSIFKVFGDESASEWKLFVMDVETYFGRLGEALAGGEPTRVTGLLHAMKGAVSCYGLKRLEKLLARWEEEISSRRFRLSDLQWLAVLFENSVCDMERRFPFLCEAGARTGRGR